MEEHLREYRAFLVNAEQKAQEDFDKTVLSLSGGALGISFAFVKDIVGVGSPHIYPEFLLGAWLAWGLSITFVLASFYFSHHALRAAIKQVDTDKAYKQTIGGWYSRVTAIFNALVFLLFFVGVVSLVVFSYYNLR